MDTCGNITILAKEIVKHLCWLNVLEDLVEASCISKEDAYLIKNIENTETNKARMILNKVFNGTEETMNLFKIILVNNKMDNVVLLMNGNLKRNKNESTFQSSLSLPALEVNSSPTRNTDTSRSVPTNLHQLNAPLKVKVCYGHNVYGTDANDEKVYKNSSQPRGVVFIANFKQFENDAHPIREGSEIDVSNLTDLFTQMGYDVLEPVIDNSKRETLKALNNFADNEKLLNVDSAFVIIMSHGKDKDSFYTSDNNFIAVNDVLEKFNTANCKALTGKPKIFIFQYCRGTIPDRGVPVENHPDRDVRLVGRQAGVISIDGIAQGHTIDIKKNLTVSDMYKIYSSLEGYSSHRNPDRGSWLIEAMCEEFMNNAHSNDIETMTKMVDQRVQNYVSTDGGRQGIESRVLGFNKFFYFNPMPHLNQL